MVGSGWSLTAAAKSSAAREKFPETTVDDEIVRQGQLDGGHQADIYLQNQGVWHLAAVYDHRCPGREDDVHQL